MGIVKVDKEGNAVPAPPVVIRKGIGVSQAPGSMERSPSVIPPPPLPLIKGTLSMPISSVDEDCVTKRLYVGVFQPVESNAAGAADPSDSVEAIRISPDDTPRVSYNTAEHDIGKDAMDIDEDAVTKELRIERITDFTGKRSINVAAVQVRSLPSNTDSWKKSTLPPQSASRGGIRSAVHAIFPALFGFVQKAVDAITISTPRRTPTLPPKRSAAAPSPSPSPKTDKPRLRLSVNTYTRDLYQEIRHALKPAPTKALPVVDKTGFSIDVAEPPKISVNALLLRRAEKYSLLIRGRAVHPIAIRDIMVFADKKKVLYLSNALREDAGYMEFSADVPLVGAVSSVLVVARHDDHVMGSQSLLIKKTG